MLSYEEQNGHAAVVLENELLRVVVLPGKGADISQIMYKPSGIDFLMKTPSGLQPPGAAPPADFLENYEGGWQELFPNANDACTYAGQIIPFHGEVALLPWDCEVERDDEDETALRLRVECRRTPLRLERRMRLRRGEATLQLDETVTNASGGPADLVWGHHVVLGGDFLEDGCRLEVPAGLITTGDALYEPETAALAPGQVQPWPTALTRAGQGSIDLRRIPGPEAHTHDDACLGELKQGWIAVTNPRLRLTFRLEWEVDLFRWVMLWMPYGGAEQPPLTGVYGVGIEPWVSRFPLARAVEEGQAVRLGPGQSRLTSLRAEVIRS